MRCLLPPAAHIKLKSETKKGKIKKKNLLEKARTGCKWSPAACQNAIVINTTTTTALTAARTTKPIHKNKGDRQQQEQPKAKSEFQ